MSIDSEVRWCVEEHHPTLIRAGGWSFVISFASEKRARDAYEDHRRAVAPSGWDVQLVKVTTTREVQA